MNDVVKMNIPALAMNETDLIAVLQSSLYPGAKAESVKLVVGYCKASNLDPMLKPIHIVPLSVKTGRKNAKGYDEYETRDVIMPGVGLYRTQAARTGEYAGMSDPEFGPEAKMSFREFVWEEGEDGRRTKTAKDGEVKYPEWCRITVRRMVKGQIVEFAAKEYWLENYATAGKDSTSPNAMWKRRPFGQLAKCAEAQALRKGFPETGAEPTADEMSAKMVDDNNGTTIDHDTGEIMGRTPIQQPQSKSQNAAPSTGEPTPKESGHAGTASAATKSPPASEGQIKNLRGKIASFASSKDCDVATAEKIMFEAHPPIESLDGLTVDQANQLSKWIRQQSPD